MTGEPVYKGKRQLSPEEQFEREFEIVVALARKWGWCHAIPDLADSDKPVRGMILGMPEYIDELILHLEPEPHWRSDVNETDQTH